MEHFAEGKKCGLWSIAQERLAELGFYKLRIDGQAGPGTKNAIRDFTAVNGFRTFDRGALTALLSFKEVKGAKAPAPVEDANEPLWLAEARRWLGTREVVGTANNPDIMKWATDLDQWYPGDDVPWCGLFIAHCMKIGAPNEPQDFNRLGAREWLKFGERATSPYWGGVCVFWRESRQSWKGHVAIAVGMTDTVIRCIGGNQNDSVSIKNFPRSRLLGMRVPKGYSGPVMQVAPVDKK